MTECIQRLNIHHFGSLRPALIAATVFLIKRSIKVQHRFYLSSTIKNLNVIFMRSIQIVFISSGDMVADGLLSLINTFPLE